MLFTLTLTLNLTRTLTLTLTSTLSLRLTLALTLSVTLTPTLVLVFSILLLISFSVLHVPVLSYTRIFTFNLNRTRICIIALIFPYTLAYSYNLASNSYNNTKFLSEGDV